MSEVTLEHLANQMSGLSDHTQKISERVDKLSEQMQHGFQTTSHRFDELHLNMNQRVDELAQITKAGFDDVGQQLRRIDSSFKTETGVTRARLHRIETHMGLS